MKWLFENWVVKLIVIIKKKNTIFFQYFTVCKFVAEELEQAMKETGKNKEVLQIGHQFDKEKKAITYTKSYVFCVHVVIQTIIVRAVLITCSSLQAGLEYFISLLLVRSLSHSAFITFTSRHLNVNS